MKITTSLYLLAFVFIGFSIKLHAGIVFDGSLGTNAPPAFVGGYAMTPFDPDGRPLFITENQVRVPSLNCNNYIGFSDPLYHYRIGAGWATWSHGYTGDVYAGFGSAPVTITLPLKTNAFYCYVEPNVFNIFSVEATANDGTTSGPINVNGVAGATGFAFYTTGGCMLTSITITVDPNALGFAIGEFGINIDEDNGALSCKSINVSLDEYCRAYVTPQMLLTGLYPCWDAFEVTLSHYGNPVPNPIDSHYLNQHLIATVTDRVSGNSCWSNIIIEDKLAPVLICRADTTDCYLFDINFPLNYSGHDCSAFTVKTIDEQVLHFDCNDEYLKVVYRQLEITDANGNTDQCTDTILVERIEADDIIFPDYTYPLFCEFPYLKDDNGFPSPLVTGYPLVLLSDGYYHAVWPLQDFLVCNLYITYEDIDLGEINCVRKIMRNWTVREWWCNTEIVRNVLQIITISDYFGPVITHAPYDFSATTGRRDCEARVLLPSIEAYDVCHDDIRVDIAYPGGILLDQNGGYADLPVGIDTVIYRLYDACYNLTTDTLIVTVRDETEPVAVCDRNTVVAITHNGYSWVSADVFDDGSFDECALHHFEVRRMDRDFCGQVGEDDWGPEVGFCCDDVGNFVMVGFKAIDHSGNEAVCMVNVEVQDKDRPLITCLPSIVIDCRFDIDYNHLEVFGKIVTDESERDTIVIDPKYFHLIYGHPLDGIAQDNCPPTIVETVDQSHIDQCGLGHIVRTFYAVDQQGNQSEICTQIIYVINAYKVTEDSIVWPQNFDTSGTCRPEDLIPELLSAPYSKPIVSDDECSLIGLSYEDQVFAPTLPGDPCFKILRKWKVIDWCQRDYYGDVIIWTHTQILKVQNNNDPTIIRVTADTVVCSYDINCAPIPVSFSIEVDDDCTPIDQMLYTYKIDFNGDGTIDVSRSGIGENVASGTWPIGRHVVKWEVEDRCGNTAKTQFVLDLRNCKSPVAYCLNGLSTSLIPMDTDGNGIPDTAMDTVWASDFDAGSFHNCGYDVYISFSSDITDTYRIYDCDSIGTRTVEMWVTDINGNTSFCRTFIDIQDNSGFCPGSLKNSTVEGFIQTENGSMVQNVRISLLNSGLNDVYTSGGGRFSFPQIPNGSSLIVKPYKNDNWLNGISTADIVKIQRHILGIDPFLSPYKMIAADVNKSNSITAKDVSDMRRMILGIINELSGNTSWRFVDQVYVFPDIKKPWDPDFPESIEINALNSNLNLSFVAIKTGDVNQSAATSGFGSITGRGKEMLELECVERNMLQNEISEIEISAANGSGFDGLQFTLQWDATRLELLGVSGNDELKIDDDNYSLLRQAEGKMSFSWNGAMNDLDWLLKLRFKALRNTKLSEALIINSAVTPVLSVLPNGEGEAQVSLRFRGTADNEFVVLQNEPNPWNHETTIGLLLPQSGEVGISVYDLNGKIVLREKKLMSKGYNEFLINSAQIDQAGVYYYQIDYDTNTITRKMVLTE